MAKLWKRELDGCGKARIQEVDLSTLAITSPTIIYMAGIATKDTSARQISGGLKRVREILGDGPESFPQPQIYAWSLTGARYVFNQIAYNLRPEKAFSADAKRLARSVILPLVSENNAPLPVEEAEKRLRNLTLFGYSSGTIVAQEVFNASTQVMQELGFREAEARRLLQEVVLISAGNISRPEREKNRFTTLYLVASNDRVVRLNHLLWNPLRVFFAKHARKLDIRPLSKTSVLITATVEKRTWEWRKTPDGKQKRKAIHPVFPRWTGLHAYHEPAHYITNDDSHSPFSKLVLYALLNAVNRNDVPDALKLLEPVKAPLRFNVLKP